MSDEKVDHEAAALMAMMKEFAEKRGMKLVPANSTESTPSNGSEQPQLFPEKNSPAPKRKRSRKVYVPGGMDTFCKLGDRIEVKFPDGRMRILSVTKVTRYVMRLANTSSESAIKKSMSIRTMAKRHTLTEEERALAHVRAGTVPPRG